MKRILLSLLFVLVVSFVAANDNGPRAIGGRVGGSGIEVSYQHGFNADKNMLSIDLGFGWNHGYTGKKNERMYWFGFGPEVAVTYDWINPFNARFPWDKKGEWKWYMGVGAATNIGFDFRIVGMMDRIDRYCVTGVGVAGRVGVEYTFWFPLQLSVDWRPIIGPEIATGINVPNYTRVGYYYGGLYGISTSIRYRF